jgi:DNA-binding MarR family transcriptional regulator
MRMADRRQALIAELGSAMQAYQRSTQAFDDAVGRALGLNATDLRCLDWLVEGPRSAGDLAMLTDLSSAATTTLIDRLDGKGYVRRTPDPGDRRRVLVELTEPGRNRVNAMYGPLVGEGVHLLDGAPIGQLEAMGRWLVDARELTDRHRARLKAATTGDEPGAA